MAEKSKLGGSFGTGISAQVRRPLPQVGVIPYVPMKSFPQFAMLSNLPMAPFMTFLTIKVERSWQASMVSQVWRPYQRR